MLLCSDYGGKEYKIELVHSLRSPEFAPIWKNFCLVTPSGHVLAGLAEYGIEFSASPTNPIVRFTDPDKYLMFLLKYSK